MSNTSESSTALLTDHYELTMIEAALQAGTAHRASVFEVFARRLSGGRRYGVVAGTQRVIAAIEQFRFTDEHLAWLAESGVVNASTLSWLADYRFAGDIWAYPEGELFFPGSPVLIVEGTFAECVVLETLILSILNHDAAIATAAARMTSAAGSRPCFDMGSRRAHEAAAVSAARAAYIAGFAGTSNLEAGSRYGIPTMGTAAHAFTLLHDSEVEAFTAQVAALGGQTTLLVDTYDIEQGVDNAVAVAGKALGGVRIDSGDLGAAATAVRKQLDALGAADTRITVTSDLDEHAIAALAVAPVDSYGVGTKLVTGSGVPTVGFVYKLVARQSSDGELQPVAKKSQDKLSVGGRKDAHRLIGPTGIAEAEVITIGSKNPTTQHRPLLMQFIDSGKVVDSSTLADARDRFQSSRAELPVTASRLSAGDPAIETVYEVNS